MAEIILDTPVSGRYMRFVAPCACSIAELEFGADGPSVEPAAFTVARDDLTNQYAVLSWTYSANVPGTVVYRSYGEAGPWTEVADLAGVSTWKDTTAPLCVPCYYKAGDGDWQRIASGLTAPACVDATKAYYSCGFRMSSCVRLPVYASFCADPLFPISLH